MTQIAQLYASGIYTEYSPTYDELFGFSESDVKQEVQRGKKLACHHCQKRGATAGCEVNSCRRSYHYPCAKEANARIIEDSDKGHYILFCEKHDPQAKQPSSEITEIPSSSGLNSSKKRRSSGSRRPKTQRRRSSSSTRSSEQGNAHKPNDMTASDIPDEEIQTSLDPMFAPLESDLEDNTPPKHNSAPFSQGSRPTKATKPSSTATTSFLNGCNGDSQEQLHRKVAYDSGSSSPETPRRKKTRMAVLHSDDEFQNSVDDIVSPVIPHAEAWTPPGQQNHSTPVNEKTRYGKGSNPSLTGEDDDTDIDSDLSQSLLPSEPYNITVQCTVFMESGPSLESENSLESYLPSKSVAPEPETAETLSNKAALKPNTLNTDRAIPSSPNREPEQQRSECGKSDFPMSPDDSSPALDPSPSVLSAILAVSPSNIITDQTKESSPAEPLSASTQHSGAAEAGDMDTTVSLKSSAAAFWDSCNKAGCTEEIFSELVSQLSSLGGRIKSQKATQQDLDLGLKMLKASGRLPTIITQLEQDLEKQEQELLRKKAALRDARSVLRDSLN